MLPRFFILSFLICFFNLKSQDVKQLKFDSLTKKFIADSTHIFRSQKYRPYANIDFRNTFIRNKKVPLNGFQLGITYKERHSFAIGGYRLFSRLVLKNRNLENLNSVSELVRMKYLTFFYQYALVDKRFFEFDLPVEIGYGSFSITRFDSVTNRHLLPEKAPIALAGIGTQVVIKPTRWIGISGLVGYRFVRESLAFNEFSKLDGFYYSIGAWLDIRQVIRDVRFYGFVRRKYRANIKKQMYFN